MRFNYFSLSGKSNAEPRISFNYKIGERLIFKSAAGKYRQYVTQIPGLNIETIGGLDNLVWILADEDAIPVTQSIQLVTGFIYTRSDLTIDLELYYKDVTDISVFNFRSLSSSKYFYGSVLTYGGDLLIRKSFGKLNTWVCYTLSRSMMDIDSIQPDPFYSIYDQTHVLDLGTSLSWKKFKFSAGWKYRTGLASLPGIRTMLLSGLPSGGSTGTPVSFIPGSVEEYKDRFPAFHQLDISGMYLFRPRSGKWNGSIGFSITNAYNQKNIIEQLVRHLPQGDLLVNRYSLGFAPNVALTINW